MILFSNITGTNATKNNIIGFKKKIPQALGSIKMLDFNFVEAAGCFFKIPNDIHDSSPERVRLVIGISE